MNDVVEGLGRIRDEHKNLDDHYGVRVMRDAIAELERMREALITIADRLEDEGCQCDASDEYVYKCNLCVANDALKYNRSTLNTDKV